MVISWKSANGACVLECQGIVSLFGCRQEASSDRCTNPTAPYKGWPRDLNQILVARHTMQLPWGTAPPFRQPQLNDNRSNDLRRVFSAKLEAQDKANRLWQFMTQEVDKTDSETSDEREFVASYALYFLLENCVSEWSADDSHVCHIAFQHCWTTSWGPVAVLWRN